MERRSFLAMLGFAPFAPVSALAVLTTASEPKPEQLPTITYRTSGKWGAGSMDTLNAIDVDHNFYNLSQRLEALENKKG